jgi:hypothetical protein
MLYAEWLDIRNRLVMDGGDGPQLSIVLHTGEAWCAHSCVCFGVPDGEHYDAHGMAGSIFGLQRFIHDAYTAVLVSAALTALPRAARRDARKADDNGAGHGR